MEHEYYGELQPGVYRGLGTKVDRLLIFRKGDAAPIRHYDLPAREDSLYKPWPLVESVGWIVMGAPRVFHDGRGVDFPVAPLPAVRADDGIGDYVRYQLAGFTKGCGCGRPHPRDRESFADVPVADTGVALVWDVPVSQGSGERSREVASHVQRIEFHPGRFGAYKRDQLIETLECMGYRVVGLEASE